jgi:hypothetical protein
VIANYRRIPDMQRTTGLRRPKIELPTAAHSDNLGEKKAPE